MDIWEKGGREKGKDNSGKKKKKKGISLHRGLEVDSSLTPVLPQWDGEQLR